MTGALAFSIIPGMQTRVLLTAKEAPTLGIALNASGFQIAAAFSAWLGGQIIESELGLEFVPLAGASVTAIGGLLAFVSWMRERRPAMRLGAEIPHRSVAAVGRSAEPE